MGPIVCPERTVINYHYSLRNNPEGRSFHKEENIFFNLVQKLKNESFLLNPAICFAARTDKRSGKKEHGFSKSLRRDIRNQA
jgi:hypothetical protein